MMKPSYNDLVDRELDEKEREKLKQGKKNILANNKEKE